MCATFDSRYDWKCDYCSYKMECNGYLKDELGLPIEYRRWWETYKGAQRRIEVPKRWVNQRKTIDVARF